MRLLGALAPNTVAGTIDGKAPNANEAAEDFNESSRNFLREISERFSFFMAPSLFETAIRLHSNLFVVTPSGVVPL
jgi:hypothetical protein